MNTEQTSKNIFTYIVYIMLRIVVLYYASFKSIWTNDVYNDVPPHY